MRCEEALGYWQRELLGQPVDRAKLEEAYAHIGTCQELCARTLSATADFNQLASPEQRAGQTDLYEALGLSAEEEGDAHARQWARLTRLASVGKASQEAIDYQRAMALAAWQSAANYYQEGLRIGKTAFLSEGIKRIQRKRLEPARPTPRQTKTAAGARVGRITIKKKPTHPATPGQSSSSAPHDPWPLVALVAHESTRFITVGQRPAGWQINNASSGRPSVLRENPISYGKHAQEMRSLAESDQPQLDGMLTPFALALWASEFSQKWELELLVRAPSPRRPWTSIMLTLEDQEQRVRQPTLMQFGQHDPEMIGWWARLKQVDTGDYQLRLAANDTRGKLVEDATLGLHLITED